MTAATGSKKVLVIGLFLSEQNKKIIMRTAADQLAELLDTHGIETITVSQKVGKVGRFIDTVSGIVKNKNKYDIGIVPLYGGTMSYIWEAVASILLKRLGKKVVLIVHGGSIPATMKSKARRYLRSFKRADVVVCPSAYMQTELKIYGVDTILIENVIRLEEYTFHQKQSFGPSIFWMRTLEDVYNPEMAVRVAGLLAKKYPDFKMVMAGYDRGMLAKLKELASALGLEGKIQFPGYINRFGKDAYATTHDIYICTNRLDNAPVTFIEMMAMGLPIVSVNVGGIPYFINNGQNGLLVPPNDDEAMAVAIEKMINNPQHTRQMVENALAFTKQFDAKPVLQKWIALFQQLSNSKQTIKPKIDQ